MTELNNSGADTFGAVLIDAKRKVLLRQPTGQFGGYAWTFAKGRSKKGEAPSATALRHVLTDTGWHAEILADIPGTFAGTTSTAKFFLAGRVGRSGDHGSDTAAIRWATFNEAVDLIRESPNVVGRERDLAILRAAEAIVAGLPWDDRPAACEEDGEGIIRPLPEQHAGIPVDLLYDEAAMRRIHKGFLPADDDDKWFIWFRDNVLYMHRSWTGFCIYQVCFERAGGGWRATTASVNRCSGQYKETRADVDRQLLAEMIEIHLINNYHQHPVPFGEARAAQPNHRSPPRRDERARVATVLADDDGVQAGEQLPAPFAHALALAEQPNYLGAPAVVAKLLRRVVNLAIDHFKGTQNFNGVWGQIWDLSAEITAGDRYLHVPGWHAPEALGAALQRYFHIPADPLLADDLQYPLSEVLMAIFLQTRDLLNGYVADPQAEWHEHAVPRLNGLIDWAVTVFLGTNDMHAPGVTVADFTWKIA